VYVGEVKERQRHGKGMHMFANGAKSWGHFWNGQVSVFVSVSIDVCSRGWRCGGVVVCVDVNVGVHADMGVCVCQGVGANVDVCVGVGVV